MSAQDVLCCSIHTLSELFHWCWIQTQCTQWQYIKTVIQIQGDFVYVLDAHLLPFLCTFVHKVYLLRCFYFISWIPCDLFTCIKKRLHFSDFLLSLLNKNIFDNVISIHNILRHIFFSRCMEIINVWIVASVFCGLFCNSLGSEIPVLLTGNHFVNSVNEFKLACCIFWSHDNVFLFWCWKSHELHRNTKCYCVT